MSKRLAPCRGGGKHKWRFVSNHNLVQAGPNRGSISLRGWYRCELCNQGKIGEPITVAQEKGHAE